MKKSDVIKYFGTQTKVAEILGLTRGAVHLWNEDIPEGRAAQLEILTKGKLKARPLKEFKQAS